MKFADKAGMALSSLLRRKLRTMLTVLGVMIGVASIVTMMGLAEGLNRQSLEMIEQYGGLRTIEVREGNGQNSSDKTGGTADPTEYKLSDETMETISAMEHVESVYPTLEFTAVIQSGPYILELYGGQAMPLDVLKGMKWEFAEGDWPKEGDDLQFVFGNMVIQDFSDTKGNSIYWNTGKLANVDLMKSKMFTVFDTEAYYESQGNKDREAGAGSEAAADSGTPGDPDGASGDASGTASASAPPKKFTIPTAGVLAGGLEDYNEYSWYTYCDLDALLKTYKKVFKGKPVPGQPVRKNGKAYNEIYYSKLNVIVDEIENVADLQKEIGDMGYQTASNSEWIEQQREQSRSQQAMLGGIGAVSLLVAAIGIANTMMMSIYERTKEIGVMKVIGCGLKDIQQLFLIEAGMIGFAGGVTGLLLSLLVCVIINRVTGSTTAVIPLWMYGTCIVFAVLVSMAAGFAPSRRAMTLSALEAIRSN